MRNRSEIEQKIEYWLEKLDKVKLAKNKPTSCYNDATWIYGVIDALLWVIDDESGMKI